MRVLVVGPEPSISMALRGSLFARDLEINNCNDPRFAIKMIDKDQPDIVLIDTENCHALPVFFSHLKDLTDPYIGGYYPVVIGIIPRQIDPSSETIYLDLGFDLVFQKPIENRLFFSRLAALDRRIGIGKNTLSSPHLLINTKTQNCSTKTMKGQIITKFKVTPFQFSILKFLLQTPRGTWSRDELARKLKADISISTEIGDRAIDKAVCYLRQELRKFLSAIEGEGQKAELIEGYKYPFIQTNKNFGYYFFDAISLPSDIAYIDIAGEHSGLQGNYYTKSQAEQRRFAP